MTRSFRGASAVNACVPDHAWNQWSTGVADVTPRSSRRWLGQARWVGWRSGASRRLGHEMPAPRDHAHVEKLLGLLLCLLARMVDGRSSNPASSAAGPRRLGLLYTGIPVLREFLLACARPEPHVIWRTGAECRQPENLEHPIILPAAGRTVSATGVQS